MLGPVRLSSNGTAFAAWAQQLDWNEMIFRVLKTRAAGLFAPLLTASALSLASAPTAAMLIYVDPVAGLNQVEPTWDFTRLTLDVEPSDSIENIMAKIVELDVDIVADRQLLFYGPLQLNQAATLADYNIQKMAVLLLASTTVPSVQAVPEPSSAWLVLLAGLSLVFSLQRKPRRSSPA